MNPAMSESGGGHAVDQGNLPTTPALQHSTPSIPDHELLRCIGRGSYGGVWLARNKLGTYRAVKIVYRSTFEGSRPFEREFKGIQKFEPLSRSHEGLVDILQVGSTEEYFYYVMELADDASGVSKKVGECVSEKDPRSDLGAQGSTRKSSPINLETYVPKTLRSLLFPPAYFPTRSPAQQHRLPIAECIE